MTFFLYTPKQSASHHTNTEPYLCTREMQIGYEDFGGSKTANVIHKIEY